ncbi:MAG: primosomal protein N' [bacterium]|nr:primosomal protein N' [bacterium]
MSHHVPKYAQVAVDAPVAGAFHYHIPPELEGRLQIGHLVRVGFRTAQQPGIVIALDDHSPVEITKPVLEILDPQPVVTPEQIDLAHWMSERYLAALGQCLWLMLPPGIVGRRDVLVTLLDEEAALQDSKHAALVDLLRRRGALRGEQIQRSLKDKHWEKALNALVEQGIVQREATLGPPRVRPRVIRVAALAIQPDSIIEVVDALPSKHRDLLEHILRVLARESRPVDVSWVFAQTGAKLDHLKRLAELGLVWLGEQPQWRASLAKQTFVPLAAPKLSRAQAEVWSRLQAHLRADSAPHTRTDTHTFLLHGVTGSGKTEIYLRAIEEVLLQGKQAIFLVPEIALTPQTIRRVAARFPGRTEVVDEYTGETDDGQIALIHSGLHVGERYDTWRRARDGLIDVVVGTRSALFTPLPNLGLVILDEEHDDSYKQSPMIPPYYHTRTVAEQMMQQRGGTLILGSATPDLGTMLRAERGEIEVLRLPDRIMGHRVHIAEQSADAGVMPLYRPEAETDDALTMDMPPVEVVDMRDELRRGNTSIFSAALRDALAETLARREQAILFLNRRGAATYVFCRDCGYVAACPRCEMPLTYHQHDLALRCHHCGHQARPPERCPRCESTRIRYFGAGTQQVEEAFKAAFPDALALRWDADTAARQGAHDLILDRFVHRQADVLIGTQMIAKGLDLPLVTLVGVVSADTGLGLPDYRAGERTFQTLTQVAGRAGRGVLGGRVVLQTYQPDHYAIAAASRHDYAAFYQNETAARREIGYPPFRRMIRLLFRDPVEARARDAAERTAHLLREALSSTELSDTVLIGPAPCFFGRVNNVFRWHVLLRGSDPARDLRQITLPRECIIDPDPADLL